MISSTPAARASGGKSGILPAEQGALGREARAQGDHEPPVARHRLARTAAGRRARRPRWRTTCCRSAAARSASARAASRRASSACATCSITRRPAECSTKWAMSSVLSPLSAISASAISFIMPAPMRRTSLERTTRGRPPGYSKPIAPRCSERNMVRCSTISGPAPSPADRDGPRPVREDRVGHRALQPIVEEVGRGADLHRHHHRAVVGERAQVVGDLLQRHHRARAAGVAHVHALDGRLEPELVDDLRVEARAHPPGAGGGGEEVDVLAPPARPLDGARHRRGADLHRPAAPARR